MFGEVLCSMVGATVQEISSALAYRLSETVRIRNSRGLKLVLQFIVFAVLVVPIFLIVGLLFTLGFSWLSA